MIALFLKAVSVVVVLSMPAPDPAGDATQDRLLRAIHAERLGAEA